MTAARKSWIGRIGWMSLILFLCGCGYRLGDPSSLCYRYQTVSVPYVKGDIDGLLTNALIRQLSRAGFWRVANGRADLILCAEVVCCKQENIGYQFERTQTTTLEQSVEFPSGKPVKRLLPNESRHILGIELSLVDCHTGKTIFGPARVQADIDVDFDPLSTDDRMAVFSLGQLVNIDEAQEAARRSLYDSLSKKVVDLLSSVCL